LTTGRFRKAGWGEKMFSDINSDVLLVAGFFVFAYTLYRVVRYTRRKGGNADLWGTIFEGLTHYVQPQDTLKEPKQYIDKIKKKSGEGYDDED
jgi:hypothetical protein